ncbi:MAG: hypothetical protein M3N12_10590 [Verrucomicrobiota bacterium]|nr:hypothetical protein [Verrucomicrobiota bacterium]
MISRQMQQTRSRRWWRSLIVLTAALGFGTNLGADQSLTRVESLRIAESFIQHRWQASAKNLRHGKDSDGVEVHTPDRDGGHGDSLSECWIPDAENTGVAYKWGGNDSPKSFSAGILQGKAGGDVYTLEKRRRGGTAVSSEAVGIECSGFICHCWKLTARYSTSSLPSICQKLPSASALEPADIMNQENGHVLLFVRWLDADKKGALFYDAAPFSKTLASERDVNQMMAAGYQPLRYRHIRN